MPSVYEGFKPYYKWNTFNTPLLKEGLPYLFLVLNLIINGIPSIPKKAVEYVAKTLVLNLIINGIPSILSVIQKTMY